VTMVPRPGQDLEVVDAEIIPEPRATGPVRRIVAEPVVRLVRDERTRKASRSTLGHALLITQGVESWGKRAWDAGTLGVYRRQIRAAEGSGDREQLTWWVERKEIAVERRHKRLLELPAMLAGFAKVLLGSLAALVVLVLVGGVFVQLSGEGQFTSVITGIVGVIRWVIVAVSVAWTPLVMVAPFAVLLAAWREGRRRGQAPGWMRTSADDDDVTIDETTIARALDALRIPQITGYLKQGLPLQYLTPCRADGRGTHAVLRLPAGVTAEQVARKRDALATGLHRLAKEVWPSTGAEAGLLDLWIADKGALAEGAGPYPLLETGTVDVFKGVPFGKTLRGEPILAPLMGRNTLCGGQPGQGKSSAARVIMGGAALDPSCELRIWVPDSNFDFEAFRPRCSRYVMGAEDDKVEEILEHLEELHAEVQARGALLVEHETPEVTRKAADRNIGLHPVVCLLEEAHVAIQHPVHGKDIGKLLSDIVRLGRKRGIHLVVSTQAPTKDSMPRDVTRNCTNGVAFAVSDHVANDALLGQGAYRGGHRATDLIPGSDRGIAVVKGFTGERSAMVQAYFLDVSRDNDQVTPIIRRAVEAMHAPAVPAVEHERRELLDDVASVLGDDVERATQVAARLRDLPGYSERFNGSVLVDKLHRQYGVPVRKLKGYPVIRLDDIQTAMAAGVSDDDEPDEQP
jgi:S-DNA-T family DNA segregation ATPase FtsK/SpoIIIE